MAKTSIEWTGYTLNPIRARNKETGVVGHFCEKISPGCAHCYAEKFNMTGRGACGTGLEFIPQNRDKVEIFLDEKQFRLLRRRRPTMYFWENMSDLFGEWVLREWLDKCIGQMCRADWHIHQVLTKRPERAEEYLSRLVLPENIWFGVSVENQKTARERLPVLRRISAMVRFISVEPLLEQIDIQEWLEDGMIHQVIVGGESGGNYARECKGGIEEAARSLLHQCRMTGTPYFLKQLGTRWTMKRETWNRSGRFHKDRKGGDMAEWPEDLRVREFPRGYTYGNTQEKDDQAAARLADAGQGREAPNGRKHHRCS